MENTPVYRAKVRIGVDSNGKPIDKYLRASSKMELETAKQACREHFILGRPIPEDKMFYEYAEEWYTVRKEPFISDSSRASWRSSATTRKGSFWRFSITSVSAAARRWDSSGGTLISMRIRYTSSATWTTPAQSLMTAV